MAVKKLSRIIARTYPNIEIDESGGVHCQITKEGCNNGNYPTVTKTSFDGATVIGIINAHASRCANCEHSREERQ